MDLKNILKFHSWNLGQMCPDQLAFSININKSRLGDSLLWVQGSWQETHVEIPLVQNFQGVAVEPPRLSSVSVGSMTITPAISKPIFHFCLLRCPLASFCLWLQTLGTIPSPGIYHSFVLERNKHYKSSSGTSLVVQWLRILNSPVKGCRSDP